MPVNGAPIFQIMLTTMINNIIDLEIFELSSLEADHFYQKLESRLISYKTSNNFVSQTLALYNEEGICVAMSKCEDSIIIRLSPESIKTILVAEETL